MNGLRGLLTNHTSAYIGGAGTNKKWRSLFHVKGNLDETDFEETYDAAPGSIQPIVRMGDEGRTLENMRWGFKLPNRLLFNTRSEGTLGLQILEGPGETPVHRSRVDVLRMTG